MMRRQLGSLSCSRVNRDPAIFAVDARNAIHYTERPFILNAPSEGGVVSHVFVRISVGVLGLVLPHSRSPYVIIGYY